jgi:hypothetical protein
VVPTGRLLRTFLQKRPHGFFTREAVLLPKYPASLYFIFSNTRVLLLFIKYGKEPAGLIFIFSIFDIFSLYSFFVERLVNATHQRLPMA